ncbi:MAG: aminoglycoside 6-adenylyltransferase [Anaerolineae bacterium]|nr:aminoglycoside 6-adenylyltransferase [Anaerolineae bacterium]
MGDVAAAYDRLVARVAAWAEADDNVRAVLIIGSRARSDHPADAWSDLDLLVLAEDPAPFAASAGWLAAIGEAWLTFIEPTPDGGRERRVLFAGGLDVDFALDRVQDVRRMLDAGQLHPMVRDLLRRGVRALVDKDGLAARLAALDLGEPSWKPPDVAAFQNLTHDFWYHTVWTAKKLRRGELWMAHSCCDSYMKGRLLQMLAWHARAAGDPARDTWMQGRFLEEWADPRAVAALRGAFAQHDVEDVWRALEASMNLFAWLGRETAAALGYAYPTEGEAHARAVVAQLRRPTPVPRGGSSPPGGRSPSPPPA